MAIYAIGDIQGCLDPFKRLLDQISFDPRHDKVWLTGDLVNRGPRSLETLRLVRSLGDSAITVLGNHDLHLLAVANGVRTLRGDDSIGELLKADDRDELLHWIRHQPLTYLDPSIRTLMTHAGVYPFWSRKELLRRSQEVEKYLRGEKYRKLLVNMYGKYPDIWSKDLRDWKRARFIVNALTRMRYCDMKGRLDFEEKGRPGLQGDLLLPWYQHPKRRCRSWRVVFGHWSALGYRRYENAIGLDTGCLWGGALTAIRLDTDNHSAYWQVKCNQSGH